MARNGLADNLTGRTFGRLYVRKVAYKKKSSFYYECLCECGNTVFVQSTRLRTGHTKSCGCLARDLRRKRMFIDDRTEALVNRVFTTYERQSHRGKDRDIPFLLTRDEVKDLILSPCFYCGDDGGNIYAFTIAGKKTGEEIRYNGIDRINSDEGYTIENCVPCCGRCNRAKYTMTPSEFIEWIKQAYAHLSKDGE